MVRTLTVAALQTHYGLDLADNIARTKDLIRQAADRGAQVILPSELFQGPYFCVSQEERWFATAHPWREHPCVTALAPLAEELGVVLPISIFEREGPHYFNSLVMADADGSLFWHSSVPMVALLNLLINDVVGKSGGHDVERRLEQVSTLYDEFTGFVRPGRTRGTEAAEEVA